jgi:hypothetical protein
MNILKIMMKQWVEFTVFHKHLPFGCVCKRENDHEPLDCEVYLIFRQTYPLVMTNIAIENGPFIDGLPGLPIKNGDFP